MSLDQNTTVSPVVLTDVTPVVNTNVETKVESVIDPVQAEYERRMQLEHSKVDKSGDAVRAQVQNDLYAPSVKKMLRSNPTLASLMVTLEQQKAPEAFITFLFTKARVSYIEVEPETKLEPSSSTTVAESAVILALRQVDNPQSIGDLAKVLKVETENVRPTLKKLLEAGKIKSEGAKRATKYTLVPESQPTEPQEVSGSDLPNTDPTPLPEVTPSTSEVPTDSSVQA